MVSVVIVCSVCVILSMCLFVLSLTVCELLNVFAQCL